VAFALSAEHEGHIPHATDLVCTGYTFFAHKAGTGLVDSPSVNSSSGSTGYPVFAPILGAGLVDCPSVNRSSGYSPSGYSTYDTVQYSPVQSSTVQYSPVQSSTVEDSRVQ
jgi:hypothetical protein